MQIGVRPKLCLPPARERQRGSANRKRGQNTHDTFLLLQCFLNDSTLVPQRVTATNIEPLLYMSAVLEKLFSFLPCGGLVGPFPMHNFRHIYTMGIGIVAAGDLLVAEPFLGMRARNSQPRHTVNYVDGDAETVHLVLDCQIHGRRNGPAFLVAPDV